MGYSFIANVNYHESKGNEEPRMFYREGYVRFCANNFTMKNMFESIHLSNVRLQMKYRKTRCSNVPEECMWDYKELQNYLT